MTEKEHIDLLENNLSFLEQVSQDYLSAYLESLKKLLDSLGDACAEWNEEHEGKTSAN